ncbi:hypothetical protein HYH03_000841 [Edaphochlamys debaryana]|uniref:Probable RNA polymerase II nuclear localization protein SLC7A6OS n=1 Tax=Edaphochlamys debaryana TaxID=47281 RepID=A0A835YHF3_9CHLO|nr:hypothetical protein HYH03_000841 [Edaphochlamys debaryana]|eukprot:KAG2501021.1 hypothetical protein HYH03_000841 [Edaphochlamys debaryana]
MAEAGALTIVRIKRLRDDPAEPEIILEAVGARKTNKLPRYDEVLLQMQGLSVMGGMAMPEPEEVPRRRFRRLRTVEASVLEGMTEAQILDLLRSQAAEAPAGPEPGAEPLGSSTAPPAGGPPPDQAAGPGPGPSSVVSGLQASAAEAEPRWGGVEAGAGEAGPSRRQALKPGTTREGRIANLRQSHRAAGAAARYKQIRGKRQAAAAEAGDEHGGGGGLLHVYDLERLPARTAAGRTAGGGGGPRGSQAGPRPALAEQGEGRHLPQPEPGPGPGQGEGPQRAAGEGAGSKAAGPSAEEALVQQQYGSLLDEYLHSQEAQAQAGPSQAQAPGQAQAPPRRIPARMRPRAPAPPQQPAQTEGAAAAAAGPSTSPLGAAEVVDKPTPAPVASTPGDAGTASARGPEGAGSQDPRPAAAADGSVPVNGTADGEFVYDMYVMVDDGAEGGGGGAAEEGAMEAEAWPWLDAPAGDDFTVPVIEVAEDDDEFFWAGAVEAEAAQRAAAMEEHDSEDSNAESYYANSYPDEEDAPYGDGGDDDDEDDDVACTADGGGGCGAGGYSWGGALAARRHAGRRGSDDDVDSEDDEDEDDEELRGNRRKPVPYGRKPASYYRTEDDDYSEHSSFMSEEDERREAEERRRRAIFMH